MTDPAKSANEIEDVLASIRRLIGESNAQPKAEGAAQAPPEGGHAGARDVDLRAVADVPRSSALDAPLGKLLLTPAQRVTDPDDPWAPVPVQGQRHRPPDVQAGKTDAGSDAAAADADPPWGRDDRLADWGQIPDGVWNGSLDAEAIEGSDSPDTPEFEAEAGDANWPDGSAGSALRDLVLARSSETEIDDDGAEHDVDDVAHKALAAREPRGETRAEADPSATAAPDSAPPAAPVDVDAPRQIGDTAAKPRDTADAIARAPIGNAAPSDATFPEAEVGLLDEDTLRDIIAEVVREELQGALGQRITRNVRKMVRREIRLAIAADDLD